MIDNDKAAVKAAETLVKYGIKKSPVSVLPILEQMDNVIVVSFAELSDSSGIKRSDLVPMFGKNRDAITSVHTKNGQSIYIVAYNRLLPFNMIQRALARELGHIVLKHTESNADNAAEAETFVNHLLCPRPLVHAIQATGMRVTVDLLGNLTGAYEQSLYSMRHTPGTTVPSGLNLFVRSEFMPFILNFFDYHQYAMPKDVSALADFGSYMDGYVE